MLSQDFLYFLMTFGKQALPYSEDPEPFGTYSLPDVKSYQVYLIVQSISQVKFAYGGLILGSSQFI